MVVDELERENLALRDVWNGACAVDLDCRHVRRYCRAVDFHMGGLPMNIQCAICNKLVGRVETRHFDFERVTEVKVWCHGNTDTMRIDDSELAKLGQCKLNAMVTSGGVAFATKRINEETI